MLGLHVSRERGGMKKEREGALIHLSALCVLKISSLLWFCEIHKIQNL